MEGNGLAFERELKVEGFRKLALAKEGICMAWHGVEGINRVLHPRDGMSSIGIEEGEIEEGKIKYELHAWIWGLIPAKDNDPHI